MRQLSLRLFRVATSNKYAQQLSSASWRGLSTSSVCFEDTKPASEQEPERQKGVPLAFELGGVTIKNPGRRPTLGQRLAERSGTALDAPSKPSRSHGHGKDRRRGDRGSSPSRKLHVKREDQRPQGPRTGTMQRIGSGKGPSSRDQTPRRPEKKQEFRPQTAQMHHRSERPTHPRATGRPQQGRTGNPKRSSSPSKAKSKARSKTKTKEGEADASSRNRVTDPELNDYPNDESSRRPKRQYDANGFLMLKGPHQQINSVIKPRLPKLPTPSLRSSATPVISSLQVLSYVDRAPPEATNAQQGNDRDVVDNATRALSRVRDLDMQGRRDALSIVEKMARTGGDTNKRPIANTRA